MCCFVLQWTNLFWGFKSLIYLYQAVDGTHLMLFIFIEYGACKHSSIKKSRHINETTWLTRWIPDFHSLRWLAGFALTGQVDWNKPELELRSGWQILHNIRGIVHGRGAGPITRNKRLSLARGLTLRLKKKTLIGSISKIDAVSRNSSLNRRL